VEDHRVWSGVLGCSNCRERYPVTSGVADLRSPPRAPLAVAAEPKPSSREEAVRLAAFLGVTEGPPWVMLAGNRTGPAGHLAALVDGLEVVTVASGLVAGEPLAGVSSVVAHLDSIPFRNATFRGVALDPGDDRDALDEAIRVLAWGGRLVAHEAGEGLRIAVVVRGLEVLAHEDGVLVARVIGPPSRPLFGVSLPVLLGPRLDNS